MMQLRLHHQASSDYPCWCRPHPAHRWLALAVGHRRYLWKDSIFENLPARVIWCLAEHLMAVFLSMWFKLPNVVLVSQICRLVSWCPIATVYHTSNFPYSSGFPFSFPSSSSCRWSWSLSRQHLRYEPSNFLPIFLNEHPLTTLLSSPLIIRLSLVVISSTPSGVL